MAVSRPCASRRLAWLTISRMRSRVSSSMRGPSRLARALARNADVGDRRWSPARALRPAAARAAASARRASPSWRRRCEFADRLGVSQPTSRWADRSATTGMLGRVDVGSDRLEHAGERRLEAACRRSHRRSGRTVRSPRSAAPSACSSADLDDRHAEASENLEVQPRVALMAAMSRDDEHRHVDAALVAACARRRSRRRRCCRGRTAPPRCSSSRSS